MMKLRYKLITFLYLLIISTNVKAQEVFEEFYKQMRYLSARDKLISQNIQNSDTPKYLPKELNKVNQGISLVMSKTHPSHLDLNSSNNEYYTTIGKIDELKRNGNGVNLDRELFNKSDNAVKLNEAINVYNKSKSILNIAISGTGK